MSELGYEESNLQLYCVLGKPCPWQCCVRIADGGFRICNYLEVTLNE